MTSYPDRKEILQLVDEAERAGAQRFRIAELLGLHARILQRWREAEERGHGDGVGRQRRVLARRTR